MRRTAIALAALMALVLGTGCGTSSRDKTVIQKPSPAATAPASVETKQATTAPTSAAPRPADESSRIAVSPYSSKGGTAARPGTVSVDLGKAVRPTPPPAEKKTAAAPKPAPAKKEVVKAEPKPKPAPAPKAEPPKKEVATAKPAPAPRETRAAPVAKAAPKEVAVAKPGSSLGQVRQVNPEYKFIVIEFESEKPLPIGTEFKIWHQGKLVGKAKLDEPLEHWPLGVATLVEGEPHSEDTVTQ